jgi:hypothetical protein
MKSAVGRPLLRIPSEGRNEETMKVQVEVGYSAEVAQLADLAVKSGDQWPVSARMSCRSARRICDATRIPRTDGLVFQGEQRRQMLCIK